MPFPETHRLRRALAGGLGGLGFGWACSLAAARFGWIPWEPGPLVAIAWGLPIWAVPLCVLAAGAGAALLWFRPDKGRGWATACGWLLMSAVVVLPAACSHAQWPFLFRLVCPIALLASGIAWFGRSDLSRSRARFAGSAVAVVLAAAALQTTAYVRFLGARGPHTGDEGHYLVQARSIVEDGDTDIANQLGLTPDEPARSPARRHYHVSRQSAAGRLYSRHPAGLAILLAPFYLVGGGAWAGLGVVLASVLTAWNIHAAAREAGCSPAAARDLWLLFGLSSPFVVFGARVYPEMTGALWALYAARVIAGSSDGRGRWVVAALAVGTLPWLHAPRFWPAAAILAAWGCWTALRRRDRAAVVLWCSLIGLFWVWLGWWNGLRFSGGASVLQASVASGYGAESQSPFTPHGLLSAFLGPRKGLATIAPSLVAAMLLGLWGAWRHRRQPASVVPAIVFLAGAGPLLVTWYWFGGYASHPGRVFIIGLPLLAMPAARLLRDAPRPLANPAIRMAVALSAAATVWILVRPGIFDDPTRVLRRSDPAAAGFFALLPSFEGDRNPFVDQRGALAATALAAAWWIACGMRWSRKARRDRGVAARDLALPLGVTLVLALPIVLLPPNVRESELAFASAARIDPPGRGPSLCVAPREGRPVAPRVTIGADRLTGGIGAVVSAPGADIVRKAEVPVGNEGGWLVTGPVLQLAPGRYRVRLVLADVSPDTDARWDVRTEAGRGTALLSRRITEAAGTPLVGGFDVVESEHVVVRVRLWSGRISVGSLRVERQWADPPLPEMWR